jgi:hypothetical protein
MLISTYFNFLHVDYLQYHKYCMRTNDELMYNVKDLGLFKITPDSNNQKDLLELTPDYFNLVDSLSKKVEEKFSSLKNCFIPKDNDPKKEITRRMTDPYQFPELNSLADIIVPQLETSLFGCHVHVMGSLIYRNLVVSNPILKTSWLWHYDNHPNEVIKVMIYLNDVDENTAPFEYFTNSTESSFVKIPPSRTGPETWFGNPKWPNSRVPDDVLKKYLEDGYKSKMALGKKGTMLIFSQNILHRANVASKTPRDVLVFQLKPIKTKLYPYVNKKWTGSFQHKNIPMDPSVTKPLKKESIAVSLYKLKQRFLKR